MSGPVISHALRLSQDLALSILKLKPETELEK